MPREKLTRLRIKGFRSIEELDLPLGNLTVLIGANGSGKTNLVQFFLMLNYMMSGELQLYIARKGWAPSLLRYGPSVTRMLDVSLEFEGEARTSVYEFGLSFAPPDSLYFAHEEVSFLRAGEAAPYVKHLGASQAESQLVPAARASTSSTLRTVARVFQQRLTALQVYHFHDTSDEARIRTVQDVHRDRCLMTDGGNLAAFLFMLDASYPSHYQHIVQTIRTVVPYIKDFILEPRQEQILLRWRDRSGDEFGPHQLSDGSVRAIALITALLQPEKLLPSLIVIDEPELGLHPSAIGLVGSLIRAASAKTQLVVATQSPRLLAEFTPEDIVVVERHEDRVGRGYSSFERLSSEALGEWIDQYDMGALYEMNVTGGGPE